MKKTKYFFDTYAFCEFHRGNTNYKKYFKNYNIVTLKYNIIELYYWFYRYNKQKEGTFYCQFYFNLIRENINFDIIKKAVAFRYQMKSKGISISYLDALGYNYALYYKLIFLTGDPGFKGQKKVKLIT